MQAKQILVIGSLAVFLLSAWALWQTPESQLDVATAEDTIGPERPAAEVAPPPLSKIARRQILPPTVATPSEPTFPIALFTGRVLDTEGRPLPGLAVGARGYDSENHPDEPVLSDAEGRFQLPVPHGRVSVSVQEPGWTTVLRGIADDTVLDSRFLPSGILRSRSS